MELTVRSYKELEHHVRSFKKYHVMFLFGPPGTSKSTLAEKHLGDDIIHVKGGNVTPFHLYRTLWEKRDETIFFDDVDNVYRDRHIIQMLKSVCETKEVKTITWNTSATTLDKDDIPHAFETRSRAFVIANTDLGIPPFFRSLQDRGLLIDFRPSFDEVMKVARTFFKDRTILNYVEGKQDYIAHLSLRELVNAKAMKDSGSPSWRKALDQSLHIEEMVLIEKLMTDRRYATLANEKKAQLFAEMTVGEGQIARRRSTFYKLLREYEEMQVQKKRGRKKPLVELAV